jgi:hypothetical protein
MNDESKQKRPVTGPLSYPGAAASGQAEPEDELVPQRPRWKTVMWFVIVILLAALFLILHVIGVVGAGTM